MRIVVRHDMHVKARMTEMVDTAQDVERGLRYKGYAIYTHSDRA
jgi:hypothetical protein